MRIPIQRTITTLRSTSRSCAVAHACTTERARTLEVPKPRRANDCSPALPRSPIERASRMRGDGCCASREQNTDEIVAKKSNRRNGVGVHDVRASRPVQRSLLPWRSSHIRVMFHDFEVRSCGNFWFPIVKRCVRSARNTGLGKVASTELGIHHGKCNPKNPGTPLSTSAKVLCRRR